jgi:hypothetical protein
VVLERIQEEPRMLLVAYRYGHAPVLSHREGAYPDVAARCQAMVVM